MKNLLTLLMLICAATAFAQNDTIELKSGTVFTDIYNVVNDAKEMRIATIYNRVYPISKSQIARLHLGDTITTLTGWKFYQSGKKKEATRTDDVYQPTMDAARTLERVAPISDMRLHLRAAGGFGIASAVGMLVGGALSGIGAATGNTTLTYAGVGVGSAGFVLLIPTFAHVLKAGNSRE